jgi:RNA polymerase sigma-70 factor (ECF subfamily)
MLVPNPVVRYSSSLKSEDPWAPPGSRRLQVPDPVDSFESVLPAARRGEEWAIASLYRDLHPRLLRYLRAQEPADAEDLASEVWLDLGRHLSRFEGGEADLRAWAFIVARHRVVDLRRARRRWRTEPAPMERLVGYAAAGDVERDALEALDTEAAVARIAALPPDQAEVVLLRVLGGLSTKQVAAIVGKRPGAVRALQHRALKRLARTISREVVTE